MTTLATTTKATSSDVRKYDRLVQAIAARLVGTASMTRALDRDDLVAEGRLAVVEALAGLDSQDEQDLIRMMQMRIRHRMIDAIRRMSSYSRGEFRKRRASSTPALQRVCSLEDLVVNDRGLDVACELPSPETMASSAQVWRIVDELPPRERQALLMRDVEGYSGPEVGTQMGVTESRVCQLRNQALTRLRDRIDSHLAA